MGGKLPGPGGSPDNPDWVPRVERPDESGQLPDDTLLVDYDALAAADSVQVTPLPEPVAEAPIEDDADPPPDAAGVDAPNEDLDAIPFSLNGGSDNEPEIADPPQPDEKRGDAVVIPLGDLAARRQQRVDPVEPAADDAAEAERRVIPIRPKETADKAPVGDADAGVGDGEPEEGPGGRERSLRPARELDEAKIMKGIDLPDPEAAARRTRIAEVEQGMRLYGTLDSARGLMLGARPGLRPNPYTGRLEPVRRWSAPDNTAEVTKFGLKNEQVVGAGNGQESVPNMGEAEEQPALYKIDVNRRHQIEEGPEGEVAVNLSVLCEVLSGPEAPIYFTVSGGVTTPDGHPSPAGEQAIFGYDLDTLEPGLSVDHVIEGAMAEYVRKVVNAASVAQHHDRAMDRPVNDRLQAVQPEASADIPDVLPASRERDPQEAMSSLVVRIHGELIDEARERYNHLLATKSVSIGGHVLAVALRNLTDVAVQQGDAETVGAYIDFAEKLGTMTIDDLAQLYMRGNHVDIFWAYERLDVLLKADKERRKEQFAGTGFEFSDDFKSLQQIVEYCREHDLTPDTWINGYTISDEERWLLWNKYYAGAPVMDPRANQALVNNICQTFKFDADVLVPQISTLLRQSRRPGVIEADPKLMAALIHVFAETMIDSQNTTIEALYALVHVGHTLLLEPKVITPERLAEVDKAMASITERLGNSGAIQQAVDMEKADWDVRVMAYSGKNPQQIASYIAKELPKLNIMSPDYSRLLAAAATTYAQQGDFAKCNELAKKVSGEAYMISTYRTLFGMARTPAELKQLQPSEQALSDPVIGMYYESAQAIVSRSHNDMQEVAEKLLANMNDSRRQGDDAPERPNAAMSRIELQHVISALQEVDYSAGIQLARDTLRTLMNAQRGHTNYEMEWFYGVLGRHGATDDLRLIQSAIQGSRDSESQRLRYLTDFARQLARP